VAGTGASHLPGRYPYSLPPTEKTGFLVAETDPIRIDWMAVLRENSVTIDFIGFYNF
jgi:hypothetical protein